MVPRGFRSQAADDGEALGVKEALLKVLPASDVPNYRRRTDELPLRVKNPRPRKLHGNAASVGGDAGRLVVPDIPTLPHRAADMVQLAGFEEFIRYQDLDGASDGLLGGEAVDILSAAVP